MTTAADRRRDMVERHLRGRDITDVAVLDAFAHVPREQFVPPALADHAYDDTPLGIGDGQTISQPYVVAITAQALAIRPGDRVLDVGTGSGYAAAIVAMLAREVISIERVERLAHAATARLAQLGIGNVQVLHGDGTLGWPTGAPYDAIAVAAGAPAPPPALLAQLAIGGRLVIPVGEPDAQRLVRITRRGLEAYDHDDLGDVRFVPLIGDQGWPAG